MIEISNTLAHEIKTAENIFSSFQVTAPSGLLKNPYIRFHNGNKEDKNEK